MHTSMQDRAGISYLNSKLELLQLSNPKLVAIGNGHLVGIIDNASVRK